MELSIAKFDGVGTCYYRGKVWTAKNHLGRVVQGYAGKFYAYDRRGNIVGMAGTTRLARAALVDSLVSP